jgi:hypothetical protein
VSEQAYQSLVTRLKAGDDYTVSELMALAGSASALDVFAAMCRLSSRGVAKMHFFIAGEGRLPLDEDTVRTALNAKTLTHPKTGEVFSNVEAMLIPAFLVVSNP